MKWSFVPKCAAQLPKPPTWEFILKHESHESCRLTTKSKHIWGIRSSASLKYWQMNSWNWSAFEIKASSFSSWVDPAFLRCGRPLREDEHTDLPVIISDTACVCESEAGVVWPGKKSCRARVRLYVEGDGVETWAAAEQCAHIGWCSTVLLVETGVGRIIKALIARILMTILWSTEWRQLVVSAVKPELLFLTKLTVEHNGFQALLLSIIRLDKS